MNVLRKDVPMFESGDIDGSLKRIYDFLSETFEMIDYTLSRYGIQLGKSNISDTESQIKELEGRITALSSRVAVAEQKLSQHGNHLLTLDADVEDLKERVTALEGGAQDSK